MNYSHDDAHRHDKTVASRGSHQAVVAITFLLLISSSLESCAFSASFSTLRASTSLSNSLECGSTCGSLVWMSPKGYTLAKIHQWSSLLQLLSLLLVKQI